MAFDFDVTHPGDTDAVAAFPANERAHRLAVSGSVALEHDVASGHHHIGTGTTTQRNAITDWVVGSFWFNTTSLPAVLQRVVSTGPVVWENIVGSGGLLKTSVVSTTSVFTAQANTRVCDVIAVGGGGAGGGPKITTAGQFSVGSGGWAGEVRYGYNIAKATIDGQTMTIGAGGTASAGANGGNGGDTTVGGASIVAAGGTGGGSGTAVPSGSFSGAGIGAANSGSGGNHGSGTFPPYVGLIMNTTFIGGYGGSTPFGAGGASITSTGPGLDGTGRGAGGSGGVNGASQAARAGGAGIGGLILIREYA